MSPELRRAAADAVSALEALERLAAQERQVWDDDLRVLAWSRKIAHGLTRS